MGRQLHSQDVSGPWNWVREGCTCLSSLCHPQNREGGSLRDPEQVPSLGPNQWGFMESSPQGDGEDKDHLPFSTRMMHLNPPPRPHPLFPSRWAPSAARCYYGLQSLGKFIGFKRSGSLVVKVLQTSKNLLRKMGSTAALEKAGARSLETSAPSCPPWERGMWCGLSGLCVLTWEMGSGQMGGKLLAHV